MADRRPSLVTGALVGYVATAPWTRRRPRSTPARTRHPDGAAARVGVAMHRSFGVGYGILTAALVRRGWSPRTAGLTVGAAAFLVVDEGTALPQLTAYPMVSHLRGVAGHATFGLAAGALLGLLARR